MVSLQDSHMISRKKLDLRKTKKTTKSTKIKNNNIKKQHIILVLNPCCCVVCVACGCACGVCGGTGGMGRTLVGPGMTSFRCEERKQGEKEEGGKWVPNLKNSYKKDGPSNWFQQQQTPLQPRFKQYTHTCSLFLSSPSQHTEETLGTLSLF